MEQFSFSTTGVQQWQVVLYTLPEADIQREADAARSNFKSWLPQRFSLSPSQLSFLDGLDPAVVDHWGQSVGFFIDQRWPIHLHKPDAPITTMGWKRVTSEDTTEAPPYAQEQPGIAELSGQSLVFTIHY